MELLGMALSYFLFLLLHFCQFVLAVTVCGLYGIDLHRSSKSGVDHDDKLIYAEVVGGLAALSAIALSVPFILRFSFVWIWNFVLFILWIALFGIFGKMYIGEDASGNADIRRMKRTVWIDLVNAMLWLVTTFGTFGYWWSHRERRSRFTGRARV